ncbi:unnamed protein product [Amoebophrya sp. A120]|nr:unnamed protein product [Amoebophrya sp. A120]|eukprot:GSA120T00008756001.1
MLFHTNVSMISYLLLSFFSIIVSTTFGHGFKRSVFFFDGAANFPAVLLHCGLGAGVLLGASAASPPPEPRTSWEEESLPASSGGATSVEQAAESADNVRVEDATRPEAAAPVTAAGDGLLNRRSFPIENEDDRERSQSASRSPSSFNPKVPRQLGGGPPDETSTTANDPYSGLAGAPVFVPLVPSDEPMVDGTSTENNLQNIMQRPATFPGLAVQRIENFLVDDDEPGLQVGKWQRVMLHQQRPEPTEQEHEAAAARGSNMVPNAVDMDYLDGTTFSDQRATRRYQIELEGNEDANPPPADEEERGGTMDVDTPTPSSTFGDDINENDHLNLNQDELSPETAGSRSSFNEGSHHLGREEHQRASADINLAQDNSVTASSSSGLGTTSGTSRSCSSSGNSSSINARSRLPVPDFSATSVLSAKFLDDRIPTEESAFTMDCGKSGDVAGGAAKEDVEMADAADDGADDRDTGDERGSGMSNTLDVPTDFLDSDILGEQRPCQVIAPETAGGALLAHQPNRAGHDPELDFDIQHKNTRAFSDPFHLRTGRAEEDARPESYAKSGIFMNTPRLPAEGAAARSVSAVSASSPSCLPAADHCSSATAGWHSSSHAPQQEAVEITRDDRNRRQQEHQHVGDRAALDEEPQKLSSSSSLPLPARGKKAGRNAEDLQQEDRHPVQDLPHTSLQHFGETARRTTPQDRSEVVFTTEDQHLCQTDNSSTSKPKRRNSTGAVSSSQRAGAAWNPSDSPKRGVSSPTASMHFSNSTRDENMINPTTKTRHKSVSTPSSLTTLLSNFFSGEVPDSSRALASATAKVIDDGGLALFLYALTHVLEFSDSISTNVGLITEMSGSTCAGQSSRTSSSFGRGSFRRGGRSRNQDNFSQDNGCTTSSYSLTYAPATNFRLVRNSLLDAARAASKSAGGSGGEVDISDENQQYKLPPGLFTSIVVNSCEEQERRQQLAQEQDSRGALDHISADLSRPQEEYDYDRRHRSHSLDTDSSGALTTMLPISSSSQGDNKFLSRTTPNAEAVDRHKVGSATAQVLRAQEILKLQRERKTSSATASSGGLGFTRDTQFFSLVTASSSGSNVVASHDSVTGSGPTSQDVATQDTENNRNAAYARSDSRRARMKTCLRNCAESIMRTMDSPYFYHQFHIPPYPPLYYNHDRGAVASTNTAGAEHQAQQEPGGQSASVHSLDWNSAASVLGGSTTSREVDGDDGRRRSMSDIVASVSSHHDEASMSRGGRTSTGPRLVTGTPFQNFFRRQRSPGDRNSCFRIGERPAGRGESGAAGGGKMEFLEEIELLLLHPEEISTSERRSGPSGDARRAGQSIEQHFRGPDYLLEAEADRLTGVSVSPAEQVLVEDHGLTTSNTSVARAEPSHTAPYKKSASLSTTGSGTSVSSSSGALSTSYGSTTTGSGTSTGAGGGSSSTSFLIAGGSSSSSSSRIATPGSTSVPFKRQSSTRSSGASSFASQKTDLLPSVASSTKPKFDKKWGRILLSVKDEMMQPSAGGRTANTIGSTSTTTPNDRGPVSQYERLLPPDSASVFSRGCSPGSELEDDLVQVGTTDGGNYTGSGGSCNNDDDRRLASCPLHSCPRAATRGVRRQYHRCRRWLRRQRSLLRRRVNQQMIRIRESRGVQNCLFRLQSRPRPLDQRLLQDGQQDGMFGSSSSSSTAPGHATAAATTTSRHHDNLHQYNSSTPPSPHDGQAPEFIRTITLKLDLPLLKQHWKFSRKVAFFRQAGSDQFVSCAV